jgi:UDP-N-acetylmuramoyl-tripeptide--D-alanyl-D-alanine ligase
MLEEYTFGRLLNACKVFQPTFNFEINISKNIGNIVLDSRLAKPGDVFIALPAGANHNPQEYIRDLTNNQVICITNNNYIAEKNVILVDDAVLALGAIAKDYKLHVMQLQKYKEQEQLVTVAVTGSNGKTTLKNMINSIFVAAYGKEQVCCTQGNLNNHLGLPLTIFSLNSRNKILIAELGMNHIGEIDYLSSLINPEIAVVNNYHHAHIGYFNDIHDIIAAKNEIFNHVTKLSIVNSHDNYYKKAAEKIADKNAELKKSGKDSIEFLAINTTRSFEDLQQLNVNLQVLGTHNYANAFTAMQVAKNLNIDFEFIKQGLEGYIGYHSRLQILHSESEALLIDDSYNANLDSTLAAFKVLQDLPLNGRKFKWVVLGDLKELGNYVQEHHESLADHLNVMKFADLLLTVGQDTYFTHHKFAGNKQHFSNNSELLNFLKHNLNEDVIALFKASKSMKLPGEVIAKLLK